MSVIEQTPYQQSVGNAVATVFPFGFLCLLKGDLSVYVNGVLQVLDADYTVAGLGVLTGGSVTFALAPANGLEVDIIRTMEQTRSTDYQNLGDFNADVVDTDIDRTVLLIQDLATQIGRSIRTPPYEVATLPTLPSIAGRAGQFIAFDANGQPIAAPGTGTDNTLRSQLATGVAALVSSLALSYAASAAEVTASVPVSNFAGALTPYNVARVGLVPNSVGAAAANTVALTALLNASVTGPIGDYIFPNITGADVYYFNNMIEVRSGSRINLNGCTLNFSKVYAAADNFKGWLTFVQDVTIENGSIVVNYDGSAGTNAGAAMRIGSRNGYPFGAFASGIDDEVLATPQGGIVVRNVRITTNNPMIAVLMLGGLDGVSFENVHINGSTVATYGIYYEFGFWHHEATAANDKSSHATNLSFKNVHINGISTTGADAFALVGALSANVDGLYINGCKNGVTCRSGEALYYNRGTPYVGTKPHINLRNVHQIGVVTTGFLLQGAESAAGGYLAAVIAGLGHPADYIAQTDLISVTLDGFSTDAGGVGLRSSSKCSLSNGLLYGTASSGQIILDDECVQFYLKNVVARGSSNQGVRADFGGAIWAPARLKQGEFHECTVAGNTGAGIGVGNSQSVRIVNCRLGFSTLYDAAAEAVQTFGVTVASTGTGVVCDGCFVTTSGGNAAYRLQGTGTRSCSLTNPRGRSDVNGNWEINGMSFATATNIADKTHYVNTADKFLGRQVYDTSNHRIMVAQGSADVSSWIVADASATVVPA